METKEAAKVELTDKMKNVMDTIEKMTVMELADLVKALEDKFGVVAAAAVAVNAGGAGRRWLGSRCSPGSRREVDLHSGSCCGRS